jgi:hypothetical protein
MNCLQFRRQLGAEPRSRDPELLAHRDSCAQCATFWQRAQRFEEELLSAMSVPVPEGLADRVLLMQSTGDRRRQVVHRRGWLAIAASVLIVLGGGLMMRQTSSRSLPSLAVAHMPTELDSLALARPVPASNVAAGFAVLGLAMRGPMPSDVTYVHDCQVGPYKAVHLVTRDAGMPVVALYFPQMKTTTLDDFESKGWKGRQVPLHDGTLVVLARNPSERALDTAESDWRAAIDGFGGPTLTEL